MAAETIEPVNTTGGPEGASSTLTVTDNRTGRTYEIPISDGTIRATDLRKIQTDPEDFGLMTYDPAFMNTASCRSAITFIDGDRGILLYRGYPAEQIAEKSTYLETAYLVVHGELPTPAQLNSWVANITLNMDLHESMREIVDAFSYSAHPMGITMATVGALSTLYPDAKNIGDPANRMLQVHRIVGQIATIGAFTFRHFLGKPLVAPDPGLSFAENVLTMMFKTGSGYKPNPDLVRALEVLFILHADHEQNCSTSAVRSVGSSEVDPYSAVAAGIAALYGPLHGGANEAVLRMLRKIGSKDNIPAFINSVKAGEGLLMGFGHRVYKSYDPRAKIIKQTADAVFEVTGRNPLLDIAIELERIALEDEYFVKRRLYPNVDFYSGLIYEALGLPPEMFTVMFAIARTSGWIAQWLELVTDAEQKISRPRQIYTGAGRRDYVDASNR